MFDENFHKNFNLDDSGFSLPVFPSKTNLKLQNIPVTPKMVRKVIIKLNLSKVSGPKELSGGSKELRVWTFLHTSWLVCVFKNVRERSTAKNYCPVSLLSVVCKVFEKLVNNRIVDHQENCMVLGPLNQLQIFLHLYLTELLGLLIGLVLLEL